jgi:regulator of sigma E protease
LTIIIAILALCVIILIHELGHFGAAKLFKMNVYQFNLGMGPIIWKKQHKETQYGLRLFPIGGSCMLGEDEDPGDDPAEFRNKPVWQRIIVIGAGAFLNLLLGFILCVIIFTVRDIPTTEISVFRESAVSNTLVGSTSTPLQVGDRIVKINGMRIISADEIFYKMENSLIKEGTDGAYALYEFEVIRDGERVVLANVAFAPRRYNCWIQHIDEDGKPLATPRGNERFCGFGQFFCGQPANSAIREQDGSITREPLLNEEGEPRYCGEVILNDRGNPTYVWDFSVKPAERTFINIINYAARDAVGKGRIIWLSLVDIIGGTYGINDLSGPVGIAAVVNEVTQHAVNVGEIVMMIVSISAFITINLGIVNLLPIPALDGARIIFLTAEAIRRKPLNQNAEAIIHFVGFALLMLLILVVTFNDVRKLIFGG